MKWQEEGGNSQVNTLKLVIVAGIELLNRQQSSVISFCLIWGIAQESHFAIQLNVKNTKSMNIVCCSLKCLIVYGDIQLYYYYYLKTVVKVP